MIWILQRRLMPVVAVAIGLTLLASLVAALDARAGGTLYAQLALVPEAVWRGEVWRLVTWTLVEVGPVSLVFACVALFWFGGALEWAWGSATFARRLAAVVLIASAGTSLAAIVLPAARWYPHLGGLALESALVIAWALTFPDRRIRVYQFLVVGGPTLAYGTMAMVGLYALFYGVSFVVPELLAAGAALVHTTGGIGACRGGSPAHGGASASAAAGSA